MSASIVSIQPFHPTSLDDELAALTLQLEELGLVSEFGKGKHPVDHPPDFEVAFASFQAELEQYKAFLGDQKLAQSMGAAVHTDGDLIADLTAQEIQSHEDHRFVLQLSVDDPEIEAPPCSSDTAAPGEIEDWISTITGARAAQSVVELSDDEFGAGPSMTYNKRQAVPFKKISQEFACIACTEQNPRAKIIITSCGHQYCINCARKVFIQATKWEQYYPPRCCKQSIPLNLVASHMTDDEIAAFQLASVEFSTHHNRVYCSNIDCRMFIVPENIDMGSQRATCSKCGTDTCSNSKCLNPYHPGSECPEDLLRLQTMELARDLDWQTCRACNRVVDLLHGCNHIT
jgi:hypothetical protein